MFTFLVYSSRYECFSGVNGTDMYDGFVLSGTVTLITLDIFDRLLFPGTGRVRKIVSLCTVACSRS